MKVIIFNAEGALGQRVSLRFRRAGHKVVSIVRQFPESSAAAGQEKGQFIYKATTKDKITDILTYERPDMVIYLHAKSIVTEQERRKK